MEINLKLIVTEDGSHSLFREDLKETYHSIHGALGESQYVFIEKGLLFVADGWKEGPINILEVGLGTGLNAALSTNTANKKKINIRYDAIEPIPVPSEIYTQLFFSSELDESTLRLIHESEWDNENLIGTYCRFCKYRTTLELFSTDSIYDLIYFDAFAPSKQPEVWGLDNLSKCFHLLKPGGVLVTYCAQGQFKRNMVEIGFEVESLPGAMGKKEMVRALKN